MMSDTWKFGQTNTNPPRAALDPSEINRLREIFRHWRPQLARGSPCVSGAVSENFPVESDDRAGPNSHPPATLAASRQQFGSVDETALAAMESLARAAGGYDPKLVTVAKLRPLLRRGQAPVTRLVNAWKRDHGCSPVEATSDDSAGLLCPTAEPSRGAFETKPPDLDFRGTADLLAPARAAVVDASVVSPETRDRLAMLLPFDTPADEAAARCALERARFAAFAAAYVELVDRPAGATEIYDGAALVYGPGLSRAYARQALQRSAPSDLEQLPNGLFWRRGKPVPDKAPAVGYHSRQSLNPHAGRRGEDTPAQVRRARDKARRELFSEYAVEYLERIGRPAGPTEIYDAAVEARLKLDFRRHNAHAVLARADNPKLRKLADGGYWLADRRHVPRHTRGRYWSRRRQMDYRALGRELVEILSARRCALRAFELRARLSEPLRAALPARQPSIPFMAAARHYPQLRHDKGWWSLIGVNENRPRGLSLDEETAVYAIDICSLRGPSTTDEIAAMLPKYMRALVDVAEVLPRVAPSFPALVRAGETWSFNPYHPVFARRG